MPLKVRFLTKCHTEKRRGRRIIKTKQCSYQEFVRYTSVALCAVGTSVTLCVTSVPSVTPCAYYISLLIYPPFSEEPLITLLPCLLLLCLMPSITLLPCLLLPCLMSSITLLPCLLLPCLMSPITLYHVFHYPVSIKECKTTKKS